MLEEILYESEFENILALYVAKEWDRTRRSVQNVSTGCSRGVLEFIDV